MEKRGEREVVVNDGLAQAVVYSRHLQVLLRVSPFFNAPVVKRCTPMRFAVSFHVTTLFRVHGYPFIANKQENYFMTW